MKKLASRHPQPSPPSSASRPRRAQARSGRGRPKGKGKPSAGPEPPCRRLPRPARSAPTRRRCRGDGPAADCRSPSDGRTSGPEQPPTPRPRRRDSGRRGRARRRPSPGCRTPAEPAAPDGAEPGRGRGVAPRSTMQPEPATVAAGAVARAEPGRARALPSAEPPVAPATEAPRRSQPCRGLSRPFSADPSSSSSCSGRSSTTSPSLGVGPRVPRREGEGGARPRAAQARSWAVSPRKITIRRARHAEGVEHRAQRLRAVEGVGEQRDLGLPAESGQLGPARHRVLVRAHRPPIEPGDELVDAGVRLHDRRCRRARRSRRRIPRGARTPPPPAGPEADRVLGHPEGQERRHEGGVGVEQGAVEIADGDGRPPPISGARARRPPAVGAAAGILVPAGTARRALARVEVERAEVQALHLVRGAERAAEVTVVSDRGSGGAWRSRSRVPAALSGAGAPPE